MTPAAAELVRATVASGTHRVDLALPGAVPVAELLPELARRVGLLDPATVYGGYRLVQQGGHVLDPDTSLSGQGVEDGDFLSVVAGIDRSWPRLYDDVAEAMADAVDRPVPWLPHAVRRTALSLAGLLLLLGAAAILLDRGSRGAGGAVTLAVVLVASAILCSRVACEPMAGVALAWLAGAYAVVAGLAVGDQPITCSGLGLLAVGLVAGLGIRQGRALVIPEVVLGAVLTAAGALVHAVDMRPAVTLSAVLVGVVLAAAGLPGPVLSITRTGVPRLRSPDDITATPPAIDPDVVAADARLAHEILLGVSTTVGVLVVVIAPFAVSLGLAGTALAAVASLVIMLRTRRCRTGPQVLVGLGSGVLGLLVTGLSALWQHHDWRPVAGVVLPVAGGLVLMVTMVPGLDPLRRDRAAEIAESACVVALPPLFALAVGAVSAVLSGVSM